MTRFFAHLCLFLNMIEAVPSPSATQIIFEAYVQVLEVCLCFTVSSLWSS